MYYELKRSGVADYFYKSRGVNMSWPAHLHGSFEFIAVLSGEMTVTVDNTPYRLSEGEAVLVFPNCIHTIESEKSEDILAIFAPDIVKAYMVKVGGYPPESMKFTPDRRLIDSVLFMSDEPSVMEKKSVFYGICAEFDKTAVYTSRHDDDKNLLYGIFDYVEKSFGGDCSLAGLSKELGYSYTYLSRYFSRTVGMSYNGYVNKFRIDKACSMLRDGGDSITSVAMSCGYDSIRTFNRNFAAAVGVTPKEYRERG